MFGFFVQLILRPTQAKDQLNKNQNLGFSTGSGSDWSEATAKRRERPSEMNRNTEVFFPAALSERAERAEKFSRKRLAPLPLPSFLRCAWHIKSPERVELNVVSKFSSFLVGCAIVFRHVAFWGLNLLCHALRGCQDANGIKTRAPRNPWQHKFGDVQVFQVHIQMGVGKERESCP